MPEETKPAQAETPKRIIDDPLLASLFEGVDGVVLEEEKKGADPVAPDIKPAAVADGDASSTDQPEKTEDKEPKAKTAVKPREDLRTVLREELSKLPPLPAPAEKKAADEPVKVDESKLSEDQRDELELARFVESQDAGRKGLSDKLAAFYREVDEYVEQNQDGERTFDSNDSEFVKWARSKKPAFSQSDKERARTHKLRHEAKEAAKADIAPEIAQLRRELQEARVTPVIDKVESKLESALSAEMKSDDPLEADVFGQFRGAAKAVAKDIVRLYYGLDQYDPKNQNHAWIGQFVQAEGEAFKKSGGDVTTRSGRKFVTSSEYQTLFAKKDPDLARVWTFAAEDVVERLGTYSVAQAKAKVKATEDQNLKYGFVKAKPSPKPETPPSPSTGPKLTSTAAPGAATDSTPVQKDGIGAEIISLLDL